MKSSAVTLPVKVGGLSLLSPRVVFVFLSVFVLLLQTLFPGLRRAVGISHYEKWFLDSYAVLASNDAVRAGIDPELPNPYDVFRRSHNYSDWWFVLGTAGLTREHNFLVGGAWVLGFLIAVFATLKPRTFGEAVWLSLLVASPPVTLAIFRANNDLVIFALLAIALVALRESSTARIGLAITAMALATGLKFYPVVAAGVLLLIPEPRRRYASAAIGMLIVLVVLASVWPQIARGAFPLEPQIHTFGSRIALLDFGIGARGAALVSPILFVLLSAALIRAHRLPEPGHLASHHETRMALAMGAALLVTCFIAGTNYAYRFIFALWVAPWCWTLCPTRSLARVGVWLLPAVLWNHGVLCVATELWFPNLRPEQYDRIIIGWRMVTEPLTWFMLALLGAWWLKFGRARLADFLRGFAASREKSPRI